MRLASACGLLGRRRGHHVHLDHHVLPPRDGGRAGDVDAAGPLPVARPHPARGGGLGSSSGSSARELDAEAAAAVLAEAVSAPHPYPRWVATAGWAGLAGGRSRCCSAPRRSRRWPRSSSPRSSTGSGGCSTGGACRRSSSRSWAGCWRRGRRSRCSPPGVFPPGTRPSLVVAAGITVLLSGLSVVGTVQDAISGYYVTAAGRAAEIALLSAGLLTGVVLGLKIGFEFGLALEVAGRAAQRGRSVQHLDARGGSARPRRSRSPATPGRVRCSPPGWPALRAGARTARSRSCSRSGRSRRPESRRSSSGSRPGCCGAAAGVAPLVVTLAGITPLLPGFTAYRGFYQLAVEGLADGLVTVTVALGIGLALAAGVALRRLPRPAASDTRHISRRTRRTPTGSRL